MYISRDHNIIHPEIVARIVQIEKRYSVTTTNINNFTDQTSLFFINFPQNTSFLYSAERHWMWRERFATVWAQFPVSVMNCFEQTKHTSRSHCTLRQFLPCVFTQANMNTWEQSQAWIFLNTDKIKPYEFMAITYLQWITLCFLSICGFWKYIYLQAHTCMFCKI